MEKDMHDYGRLNFFYKESLNQNEDLDNKNNYENLISKNELFTRKFDFLNF